MAVGWQQVYLSLGSNLGDRLAYLQTAVDRLAATAGVKLLAVSSLYETEPIGYKEQDKFYNCVIQLKTSLAAGQLLEVCQKIEQELGRQRKMHWGPRTIDIDILLFGQLRQDNPELTLPHPRMDERDFVKIPLLELKEGVIRQNEAVRLVLQDWYSSPARS